MSAEDLSAIPNLHSFFDDRVRAEKQFASGLQRPESACKWRVYKRDDEDRFLIVGEYDDEADAIAAAKNLGD